MTPEAFVDRWKDSGGAELANSQSFLKELCDLLDVPQPDPTRPDAASNQYVFEKAVEFNNGDGSVSFGRVDLFRSGCFVLESKQGSERKAAEQAEALATVTKTAKKLGGTAPRGTAAWDKAMQAARKQAKGYAEAIPDQWPPFLIVVDVGFCFDLYADFSGSGKNYFPFPDPRNFRIPIQRLREEKVRSTLRAIWLDPHSLDPSKHAADVTRDIATRLAKLAKSLESQYDPQVVAGFLMRCLFTMFAEDVELIRKDSFSNLLQTLRADINHFQPMVESLWESMDQGTFSTILREKVKHFNGKFFKEKTALPLTRDQLELLIEAASSNWQYVEPSIFGTLLERALDPVERHKLGAHYTPRAYVERLVMPTIIEPLREQWDATYASAVQLDEAGNRKEAVKLLRDFHGKLCETRVLDPACGSGNFLYVSMELMKRLEGEVVSAMTSFDDTILPGITIDPHQFMGIEINPRAAALAELVLWIGFIQWHKRTRTETTPPEPILKDYGNIQCRDAVLEWDSIEMVLDTEGKPVTRWDGRTTKPHPVTGEEVPDEHAVVQELNYLNPKKAIWPETDFIVGNPPFIGTRRMRLTLGDGYVETLSETYSDVPKNADYVMYWWEKSAVLVQNNAIKRFGLITTNSITQSFNRVVVNNFLDCKTAGSVVFAIPDHPWVDSADGAAVRVALTVGAAGSRSGTLVRVANETNANDGGLNIGFEAPLEGKISPDLRIGASPAATKSLRSNSGVAYWGTKFYGDGFIVEKEKVDKFRQEQGGKTLTRPFIGGRDLTQNPRGLYAIDCDGFIEQTLKTEYPSEYQHILDRVKPVREHNPRAFKRERWWIFGENQPGMRNAVKEIDWYIATTETAKHRVFQKFSTDTLAEGTVAVIAIPCESILGVLSSRTHVCWSLAAGGTLEDRPRYNKTRCFETFPFPVTDEPFKNRIGDLAEQLDSHRKRQQEKHPTLTMTGIYNVLEKLRSGEPLTAKEKTIHEQGLVSVLKQIHDDLDAAVFDAYGWPHDLDDEEILQRLVDLNHERAEEESRGIIRWLRPEFQNPQTDRALDTQTEFEIEDEEPSAKKTKKPKATVKIEKQPWPKALPERMVAIQTALQRHDGPAEASSIAAYYTRANKTEVALLLDTLAAVGNIRRLTDGRFAAFK